MKLPAIALLDIETAPINGLSWGLRETDVIHVLRDTYLLCFAYKWLGEKKVHTKALCDFPSYKRNKHSDKPLAMALWDVFDQADIIIAHNGDNFDIKKTQARFLVHGLKRPTPSKTIDTLKIARANFKFDSNKLDNIAGYLGIGHKLPHTGKHLWVGCMNGDPESWKMMKAYNAHDVVLLEGVYEQLKPWAKTHPILTALAPQKVTACPTCLSHNVQRRGWNIARVKKTPRFQCQSCGNWFSGLNLGK